MYCVRLLNQLIALQINANPIAILRKTLRMLVQFAICMRFSNSRLIPASTAIVQ